MPGRAAPVRQAGTRARAAGRVPTGRTTQSAVRAPVVTRAVTGTRLLARLALLTGTMM
ncbi:MAG TPA: hypothetical protein VKV80_13085 [Streptosporangiaceae bacterium]|nr:hypothetical protein [Streptosporangiaceae bacterium]